MVIVFFICHLLPLVVNVLELARIVILPLTQLSNLLVTFNSSVNFIIYITYGKKFKKIFLQLFSKRTFQEWWQRRRRYRSWKRRQQIRFINFQLHKIFHNFSSRKRKYRKILIKSGIFRIVLEISGGK